MLVRYHLSTSTLLCMDGARGRIFSGSGSSFGLLMASYVFGGAMAALDDFERGVLLVSRAMMLFAFTTHQVPLIVSFLFLEFPIRPTEHAV